jgi:hypothetical protein
VIFLVTTEAIRPDEGPVLKTGGEHDSFVGSSPTASAWEIQKTCALGRAAKVPAFQAGEAGSTPAGHLREIRSNSGIG